MPDDKSGVLVRGVVPVARAFEHLRRGDVLLALDGKEVANDGSFAVGQQERLMFQHLIHMKMAGEMWEPTLGDPNPLFSGDFRNKIVTCVEMLLPHKGRLDDEQATGHCVQFECGTLDLTPGRSFEDQLRPGNHAIFNPTILD